MNKIILVVALVAICLAIFFGIKYFRYQDISERNSQEIKTLQETLSINKKYNTSKIDSIAKVNVSLDSTAKSYFAKYQEKKAEQEAITVQYDKLKSKIVVTPDSGQHAITKSLIGEDTSLRNINLNLAEGQRCCKSLSAAAQQLSFLDSLQQSQRIQISNLNDQLFLSKGNNELSEMREQSLMKEVQERGVELAREHRRKRTWRTLFLITTGLTAGYVGYNHIK